MCFAGDMRRKHHVEKGQLIIKTCRIICTKNELSVQPVQRNDLSVQKMHIIC